MGTLVKSLVTLFVFLFNFYRYQVVTVVVVVFGVRASPVLLLPSVAFFGCTVVFSFLEVFCLSACVALLSS